MAEEEDFLLRLEDPQLAQQLRDALRSEDAGARPPVQLLFEDPQEPRQGQLVVGPQRYPVFLRALPTVVEAFKTLDDVNLVKITDIGEVLVVPRDPGGMPPGDEWPHGVTPPMESARLRHFHKRVPADPAVVAKVEQELLLIAAGKAPPGTEYVDVEEEFVVDEQGGGSWQPLAKKERGPDAPQPKAKKARKKKGEEGEDPEAEAPAAGGQGPQREEI